MQQYPAMIPVLGPQGCGKGTQGKLLQREIPNSVLMTMSAILGYYKDTDPDRLNGEHTRRGKGLLLSSHTVMGCLAHYMSTQVPQTTTTCILDGVPRGLEQPSAFLDLFRGTGMIEKGMAIFMQLDRAEAFTRCIQRAKDEMLRTGESREDDQPDAINQRLDIYFESESHVRSVLQASGMKCVDVDAVGSINEVHHRVMSAVLG